MYMSFLNASERIFLKAVSQFAYCNPFLPEHSEFERAALSPDFLEGEPVWSQPVKDPEKPRENVWRIFKKLEPIAKDLRRRLVEGADPRTEEPLFRPDRNAVFSRTVSRFARDTWRSHPPHGKACCGR
jgi:hypothetical protein